MTGAGFAAWGGMFSVVDCSLAHIRKKEDAWNSVGSGFITGGLLQIRRKYRTYAYESNQILFFGVFMYMPAYSNHDKLYSIYFGSEVMVQSWVLGFFFKFNLRPIF